MTLSIRRRPASPVCVDCGVVHGRDGRAAFCIPCRDKRIVAHRRTERYRMVMRRWNRSAKAKLVKGRWYERNREEHCEQMRIRHRLTYKRRGPASVVCATIGCGRTVRRLGSSHAFLCLLCAEVNHGVRYAKARLDWVA